LASARSLLAEWAAVGGEMDAYAAKSILEDPFIAGEVDPWPGFDAFQWLSGLTDRIRLLGQGPRPGKAHVSGLDGGHSGRPVAFVMGVNDLVIPGGDRQDPALLDVERARISPLLPLASELGGGNEAKLRRLIARKRGKVFLSHSRLDLSRDREMYAADPIHELARHSGKTIRAVAFLPGTRDMRSSAAELWLDALAAGPPRFPAREAMLNLFPGLVAGEIAAAARTSGRFTAYDGWAPEAGGIPESLSPTQLETLLANPQEYFFRWVLGIALPDRSGPPPGGWLSAADRGSLMHEVFHDFQQTLMSRGERADFALHAALLDKTLEARLRRWRDLHPPENAALYELERRDLAECARVFLHSESEFQKTAKPAYLEAAFGMEGRSAPWNGGLPATLALPSGRSVRLRGRLDRVDVSDGSGGLVIWDYKTGSPAGFSTADPFKGGKLQAALYAVALKSFFPGAEGAVSASGYFFPIPEAGGRRFLYPASALSGVVAIVDVLAGLLEEGVFPYSLKQRASRGYAPIFDAAGGAERLSAQASLKASAAAGPDILRQWLEL
jgi:RecB family exonuclease